MAESAVANDVEQRESVEASGLDDKQVMGNEVSQESDELKDAKREKTRTRTAITKGKTHLHKLMENPRNLDEVKAFRDGEMRNRVEQFLVAFHRYKMFFVAADLTVENERHEQIQREIEELYRETNEWIKETEQQLQQDDEDDIDTVPAPRTEDDGEDEDEVKQDDEEIELMKMELKKLTIEIAIKKKKQKLQSGKGRKEEGKKGSPRRESTKTISIQKEQQPGVLQDAKPLPALPISMTSQVASAASRPHLQMHPPDPLANTSLLSHFDPDGVPSQLAPATSTHLTFQETLSPPATSQVAPDAHTHLTYQGVPFQMPPQLATSQAAPVASINSVMQEAPHQTTLPSMLPQVPGPYNEQSRMLAAWKNLPQVELVKFRGDPMEFVNFKRSFIARVVDHTSSAADRLYFLYQSVEGEPKEIIEGCLYMYSEDGFSEATRLLEKHYGEPQVIAHAFMQKIQATPSVKADNAHALRQLYLLMNKCLSSMIALKDLSVLNSPTSLQMIVAKLPPFLRAQWRNQVSKFGPGAKFNDLVKFLEHASSAANDPIYGNEALFGKKEKPSREICLTTSTSMKCAFCSEEHYLDQCQGFKKEPLKERRAFVKKKELCFKCLHGGHVARKCSKKISCKICNKGHSTLLHDDSFKKTTQSFPGKKSTQEETAQSSACRAPETVLHAILPVQVRFKDDCVTTYAFYDNGSSASFITEKLASKLNASGPEIALKLTTMHGCTAIKSMMIKGIQITDIHGKNPVNLAKAYVREEMPVNQCHIPKRKNLKESEFRDLIPNFIEGLEVGLLIGANCPGALEPLSVRRGQSLQDPFALQLRHGWVVVGPAGSGTDIECHRTSIFESSRLSEIPTPELANRDFDDRRSLHPDECGLSIEDLKFLEIMDNGVAMESGHYRLPLPLRSRELGNLPNNISQAAQRATFLAKRLERDEKYCQDYICFMEDLFKSGFAEKAPPRDEAVWYLPHHGVYHPQKKKIRVVFDCSAAFKGISLNSMLLQGPNLTSTLIGVLTRFREGETCFMADIEKMFFQVKLPESDRDLLRFLWWPNGDTTQDLQEFRMTVHLFGATSSPSVCNYALRCIAKDLTSIPQVKETIERNFYVDDCLRAGSRARDVSKLAKELTSSCLAGGFRLHKFVSNQATVLHEIPKDERAQGVRDLHFDEPTFPVERALGLQWFVDDDEFGFSFSPKEKPLTKRGLLSVSSSVYDPLGICAPFMLPAKLILQELCRSSLGWDDDLPEPVKEKWQEWLTALPQIASIRLKRCMLLPNHKKAEIHVFADASLDAYGAVAYLKVIDREGSVKCSFLMGKSRVKPLKSVTIPRMELTAATVAVRIGTSLKNEISPACDVTYYTDSTSVLHFLNNEKRRFPIFVANRIQLILSHSAPSQWRYVPSLDNPADCASRGLSFQHPAKLAFWLNGPAFLLQKDALPQDNGVWQKGQDIDEMENFAVEATEVQEPSPMDQLIQYYSDWHKLRRAVCVYAKVLQILKNKIGKDKNMKKTDFELKFQPSEMEAAEKSVIRHSQSCYFQQEIVALRQGSQVTPGSAVCRLDPFYEDGLIRVGGRIKDSNLPQEEKHPILLPKKDHVTTLIVRHHHHMLHHAGRNHVLASLREKYWIVHGNAAVRRVIWFCVTCRKSKRPPEVQKMADLPNERIDQSAPFTNTGVDIFGPMYVKRGRSTVKRYGALFCCFASRAIHIEMCDSLETGFLHKRPQKIHRKKTDKGYLFRQRDKLHWCME